MWLLVAVIQLKRQYFVRQSRNWCSATSVADAIFDAIAPNVRLNPFLMQTLTIQTAYRLCLLTMVYDPVFLLSVNQILYLNSFDENTKKKK